jgi:hypothetical protein
MSLTRGRSFALLFGCGKTVGLGTHPLLWQANWVVQCKSEDATPIESLPCAAHTLVRPLEAYPRDFEKLAATYKQTRMQALSGERPLLNNFLSMCPS